MAKIQTPSALPVPASAKIPAAVTDPAFVVTASLFVALCAKVSLPLLWSPVPLSLQNFAVLLVGYALGPNRAMAALALYLMEGASGLPVFATGGPGGVAQLLGPSGGFLMSYPAVAYCAGVLFRRMPTLRGAVLAGVAAESVLFLGGVSWFLVVTQTTLAQAFLMAVAPFLPGEALKVAAAAGIASQWKRFRDPRA
ncbi:MAG: biotin transporter BioY [Acidobacteriales bacterium]|nr:biotin transporter BioY [Terriglobales bacterium]